MTPRILVIEDEEDLAATVTYALEREGFETTYFGLGEPAVAAAAADPPDLILLDLMLPDMPGTEVCRQIRSAPSSANVPIIMVTAKTDEIDRVVGFEVGADDYVVKPYSVRELLLRVRAVLRRAQPRAERPESSAPLRFGRLKLDVAAHKVWVDSKKIKLTALEFKLLQTFVERKGRVQTRDHLLADVWGHQAEQTTRTVDTNVKRLRDKLGLAGTYIETIRGVGYRFRAEPGGD